VSGFSVARLGYNLGWSEGLPRRDWRATFRVPGFGLPVAIGRRLFRLALLG
jgi:hypothetical protein